MAISLALLPIFVLIAIGYCMRRWRFPGEAFWEPAERFIYFFLFPVMLVEKLSTASRDGLHLGWLALTVFLTLMAGSGILWLIQWRVRWSGAEFTSVYQGSLRFNSYVGLAAAQALLGDSGLAVAALAMAFMIPMLNVLCVAHYALLIPQAQSGWSGAVKAMLKNPLILGSVAGLLLNYLGISFYPPLDQLLSLLSNMALPLGLLCVGAALTLKAFKGRGQAVSTAFAVKLLVFPVLFVLIGALLGLSSLSLQALAILGCLPTATASYILSRQLGGDSTLMAAIISGQTLLAMLTMPLLLPLLNRWLT